MEGDPSRGNDYVVQGIIAADPTVEPEGVSGPDLIRYLDGRLATVRDTYDPNLPDEAARARARAEHDFPL